MQRRLDVPEEMLDGHPMVNGRVGAKSPKDSDSVRYIWTASQSSVENASNSLAVKGLIGGLSGRAINFKDASLV